MSLTESTMLELGTIAPDFALTDVVTGKTVRRDDFRGQKALLVMFICTHCPYVKHIEKVSGRSRQRLRRQAARHRRHQQQRCNYASRRQPRRTQDSRLRPAVSSFLICMTRRRPWPMPTRPPARRIFFFSTRISASSIAASSTQSRPGNGVPVTGEDLRAAIDMVLAGKPVPTDQRPSIGCNIKWKA